MVSPTYRIRDVMAMARPDTARLPGAARLSNTAADRSGDVHNGKRHAARLFAPSEPPGAPLLAACAISILDMRPGWH